MPCASTRRSTSHRGVRVGRFDRIVQQVGGDGIECIGIDCCAGATSMRPTSRCTVAVIGRHGHFDQVPQSFRRRDQSVVALLPFGLQPRQQPGDLADRGAHRRQHVALELRIVGVNLGIGQKHRELPGNILDVMDDEREALAVFAKLPGLRQDLRGALFGHAARDFAPNHP